jgi:hypothetical protein
MRRSLTILVMITATLLPSLMATTASAITIVPLNTGYNHSIFAPYATVTTTTSTTNDIYWVNIASYQPTNPPAGPTWVLKFPGPPWISPLPLTNWISARAVVNSPSGTSTTNPGYTIFRECFCLLPHFTQPSFNFTVRADDTIQGWFNTQLNVTLPASPGHYNTTALTSLPSNPAWFHVGVNCFYFLVEDAGGYMGFDLSGAIQANGLMPMPAVGVNQQFQCPCSLHTTTETAQTARSSSQAFDDSQVVEALKRLAEQRRLERQKSQSPR